MRSPVLFLVFNRPETTKRVFDALREAKPPRLYVAADGPRSNRLGEAARCEESRRIATAVDWPCEVRTLFREENLGCKRAVSSAITWFFSHEGEGIVLEDDCLPAPSFFDYCDDLLERYRDDERVMCISGDNFIAEHWKPDCSYYFSRYAHIWGWASWARAWQHYRVDVAAAPGEPSIDDALREALRDSDPARRHWRTIMSEVAAGRIDTWDYQWAYALLRRRALSCMPSVNLISNIGFGAEATHTTSAESRLANLPVGRLADPLRHPSTIQREVAADAWTEANVFGIGWIQAVRRRLQIVVSRAREVRDRYLALE